MADIATAIEPNWTADTAATYARFLQNGGTPEVWKKANPDAPAPATATAPAKRALTEGQKGILQVADAAWRIAEAKAWASLRKPARGRQGR